MKTAPQVKKRPIRNIEKLIRMKEADAPISQEELNEMRQNVKNWLPDGLTIEEALKIKPIAHLEDVGKSIIWTIFPP